MKTIKSSAVFLFALFITLSCHAQSKSQEVVKIRKAYYSIKADINELKKSGSQHLYCISVDDNAYKTQPAGERYFSRVTEFYYTLNAETYQEELKMVIEKEQDGIFEAYRETLFMDDVMTFVFEKENETEHRLYRSKDKVHSYLLGSEEQTLGSSADDYPAKVLLLLGNEHSLYGFFNILMRRYN